MVLLEGIELSTSPLPRDLRFGHFCSVFMPFTRLSLSCGTLTAQIPQNASIWSLIPAGASFAYRSTWLTDDQPPSSRSRIGFWCSA